MSSEMAIYEPILIIRLIIRLCIIYCRRKHSWKKLLRKNPGHCVNMFSGATEGGGETETELEMDHIASSKMTDLQI